MAHERCELCASIERVARQDSLRLDFTVVLRLNPLLTSTTVEPTTETGKRRGKGGRGKGVEGHNTAHILFCV